MSDNTLFYYVSPIGDDLNSGTYDDPFLSIGRAQLAVRCCKSKGKQPINVQLMGGTYHLSNTLRFRGNDSGAPGADITYAAHDGAEVIISGGNILELDWRPCDEDVRSRFHQADEVLQARVPDGLTIDQFYVNGELQHMARYPNYTPSIRPYGGYAGDAFSVERASGWQNPVGGYIHAMHSKLWGGYHYRITRKHTDGTLDYEGGWQNNRQMGMHDEFRFVENILEELDAPGEWFHDKATNLLYFYPPERVDMSTATYEYAQLKRLVEFSGTQEDPVKHIKFRGICFRHAARTIMEPYEQLLRSDWSIHRGGAVFLSGTEDCEILDCEFTQIGGNAVFASDYNRRITIRRSHIHDAGGNAVCFVGRADCVRSPLYERYEYQAYEDLDLTPGPKTDNYPADCMVDDCLIHDIGVVEKQATGVQMSMSKAITVRHCSIYDVGRAGINVSEGTFGGHLIEFCDVFDTVLETDDHGSFNSWGRDRFWKLEGHPPEDLAPLMKLDCERSIIRNSRWRCDHGWDVDLDDGSSNYEIYNNLFLRGGLKLREGFCRRVTNNIAVNSTLHPHKWFGNSQDVVTNNLWMAAYRPAGMKDWGLEVDHNMFVSETDRDCYADKGCDLNSIVGDPMFVDPTSGDYHLHQDSPLLGHGFENFPMDRFGVQKPELKVIAREPEFPEPILDSSGTPEQPVIESWMGAEVSALVGEQFSAFGVKREDGGIHLISVPEDSAAAREGLREDDLIQRALGCPTRSVKDLRQAIQHAFSDRVKMRIVRDYKNHFLEIEI